MAFSAKAVANEFIELAGGNDLSPMKLQKLVYYAHGWHLAINDEPLIREDIEAWQFGPVIPTLYREFKSFGSGNITRSAMVLSPESGKWVIPRITKNLNSEGAKKAREVIRDVWKSYKDYSAVKLSNATHMKDTPWEKTYSGDRDVVIQDDVIKEYFRSLML